MFPFLYRLRATVVSLFSVRNILLQILACVLTYFIVTSGFDWKYFTFVHGSLLSKFLSPATGIGAFVPVFGIPLFYIIARLQKNKAHLTLSWMMAQAAFLGWFVSSTYKAFTGRVQPPRVLTDTLTDMSHNWNFGFMEYGIFWGWPSSHTTVAFAMSFALITYYPHKKYIALSAFLYALYIGLGISMQIHWFSELVAGAIIGAMIGTVVGKSFRTKVS